MAQSIFFVVIFVVESAIHAHVRQNFVLSAFVGDRCGSIRHLRQRSGNVSHQARCFLRLLRDQLGASAKPARLEGLSLRHYCTITTSSVEPRLETRGVPKVSSFTFFSGGWHTPTA